MSSRGSGIPGLQLGSLADNGKRSFQSASKAAAAVDHPSTRTITGTHGKTPPNCSSSSAQAPQHNSRASKTDSSASKLAMQANAVRNRCKGSSSETGTAAVRSAEASPSRSSVFGAPNNSVAGGESAMGSDQVLCHLLSELSLEKEAKENAVGSKLRAESVRIGRNSLLDNTRNQRIFSANSLAHKPGMPRGAVRPMHVESELLARPRSAAPDPDGGDSRFVTFSARIVSRSGRDALKDLFGAFYSIDNSVQIFEMRPLTKGFVACADYKVVPFLERNVYRIPRGPRKGENYILPDMFPGRTMLIDPVLCENPPPLSDPVPGLIPLRIMSVDEARRREILVGTIRLSEQDGVLAILNELPTDEELKQAQILRRMQKSVQSMLRRRGPRSFLSFCHHLREIDTNQDGVYDRNELKTALASFRIPIDPTDFDAVWNVLDVNGDGVLDPGEFLRGFFGEMSELRKFLVRKVFLKLDPNRNGSVHITDVAKFYNPTAEEAVQRGEVTKEQATEDFVNGLLPRRRSRYLERQVIVSYVDIEEYCEGLSVLFEHDGDFYQRMKFDWNL